MKNSKTKPTTNMTANEPFKPDVTSSDNIKLDPVKTKTMAIVGLVMLILIFIAGGLVGYFMFESHIIGRLNAQFDALGLGLCNTTTSYVQIDENARYIFTPKNTS